MRDWESYVIKVFLVQSICVEGRWCGPESDGASVDRVGPAQGGHGAVSLVMSEESFPP